MSGDMDFVSDAALHAALPATPCATDAGTLAGFLEALFAQVGQRLYTTPSVEKITNGYLHGEARR